MYHEEVVQKGMRWEEMIEGARFSCHSFGAISGYWFDFNLIFSGVKLRETRIAPWKTQVNCLIEHESVYLNSTYSKMWGFKTSKKKGFQFKTRVVKRSKFRGLLWCWNRIPYNIPFSAQNPSTASALQIELLNIFFSSQGVIASSRVDSTCCYHDWLS